MTKPTLDGKIAGYHPESTRICEDHTVQWFVKRNTKNLVQHVA